MLFDNWTGSLPQTYLGIKALKILTVRFSENLGIDVIQGEGTLNCENNEEVHDRFMGWLDTKKIDKI